MHFSFPRRPMPAWQALALFFVVSTSLIPFSLVQAQEDKTLPTVVVTASRFPSDPSSAPIGATVITAEEIRAAGVNNVNQAVRKIGGVFGRQNLNGTQDYDLDLRGFGVNSAQNVVVLVDGIRLSENEQAVALLSTIPINTVERIEIVRGGNSVLYGDGATGGVIHVITRRTAESGTHGSVIAEAGQFDHRELRASVRKGWDGFSLDANLSKTDTDNYRDHNRVEQENFSGGMQWTWDKGRAGFRIDVARQDSRLPGALTLSQFNANPRQSDSIYAKDFATIDTERYTAYVEQRFSSWEALAELSHREKDTQAFGWGSLSNADSRQTQFSPRMRNVSKFGVLANELVAGLDLAWWNRTTDNAFLPADSTQRSRAVYVRDELKTQKSRLAAGFRHEIFDKDSIGPRSSTASATFSNKQSLNAWELEGSHAISLAVTLFAKAGESYRVANVDDNSLTLPVNEPLKPQTSHDMEVGASVGNKQHKLTARLFQHRLKNEIFYDPTVGPMGANTNLDPTKRQGIEIEGSTRFAPAWVLSAMWRHVNAKFTDGPFEGREMVLVPKNVVTARLNWLPAQGHSASLGAQWVDEQRYGDDFANTCSARIPSYTTFDGRYARRMGSWELAIIGENLANKHYFSNAFTCTWGSEPSGIYPSAGRQLKLSARYDF